MAEKREHIVTRIISIEANTRVPFSDMLQLHAQIPQIAVMSILLHYKYIAHGALGPGWVLIIAETAGRAAIRDGGTGVDVVKGTGKV